MGRCLKLLTEDVEELKNELSELQVGDHFTLGDYHGKIEWRVLEKNLHTLFVISEYALDAKPFDKEGKTVGWYSCSLKKWLNNDFFNKAFNPEEKSLIANTSYGKIFCLSEEEAVSYFLGNSDRRCRPTQYALRQGAYMNQGSCRWWLSSSDISNFVEFVDYDGDVGNYYADDVTCSVRPAMKLRI